ncbi:MAG: hypothetical protein QXW00_04145 [Candidatus Woesearchaeota archaeon]
MERIPALNPRYTKVVWQETPQSVRVIQGIYSEDGDFIRVKGDYKEVLIRKDKVISIEHKQAARGDIK